MSLIMALAIRLKDTGYHKYNIKHKGESTVKGGCSREYHLCYGTVLLSIFSNHPLIFERSFHLSLGVQNWCRLITSLSIFSLIDL